MKNIYFLISLLIVAVATESNGQACVFADFTKVNATSTLLVYFNDTSAIAAGYTTTNYSWSFGDGATDTGRYVSHTYSQSGTYNACLNVSATNPQTMVTCVDSTCKSITVFVPNCTNFNVTISKTLDTIAQKFTAIVLPTGGQAPHTYSWSNGTTTQQITNVNPGVYCVLVKDSQGCTKYLCDTFRSNILPSPCAANFQVNSTCDSVFISNTSNIGTASYQGGFWDISGNIFPVIYNQNGINIARSLIGNANSTSIMLSYSLTNGCSDSLRKNASLLVCYSDTICGTAFMDNNGNGVFDNTDSVLKYQTVCVSSSSFQRCVQTNANGQYSIAVPLGNYRVYTNISNTLTPTIPISSGIPNAFSGYDSVIILGGGSHCGFNFGFQDMRVTISGAVYFDWNNNGVQDSGEYRVWRNGFIKIGNRTTYVNPFGSFSTQTPAGTYTISYTPTGSYAGYTVNPTSYTVVATNVGNTYSGNNFGLYMPSGTCNAKAILNASFQNRTIGNYSITVSNIGNIPISGTLILSHDSFLVLNYTSPVHSSNTSSNVSWVVGNINPSNSKSFYIRFSVPTSLQIGQPIFTLANFNSSCTDVDLSNNTDTLHQLFRAPYDPNNKLVSPTGVGEMGKLKSSQKLTYTINFQNTGTAPAVNVVLIDTLSSHLDWNSVEVKESSHSSNVTIENGILNAKYSQIMLPDSNTNEPESHGFLSFTVNMKPNLPQGTVVNNTGNIYFDYNEAVITNTTVNTIDYALSIADPTQENLTVTLYPNPFKSHTTIQIENANGRVFDLQIIDMTGRIIHTQKANSEGVFSIDRNSIASGIYTYVISENGVKRTNGKLIAE